MKAKKSNAPIQRPLPTEVLSYHDGYEAQNGTVVQYQSEWTKQHQLEGDGLLPLLYDHLWKSDRTREHRLREALIPDTVVFEHNFPRAWYTYDLKTAELVKRGGKLLDAQSIYQYFCAEEKGCDIVAQFYHKSVSVPTTDTANSSAVRRRSPLRREAGAAGAVSGGGKSAEGSNPAGGLHRHHHHQHHSEDREELTTAVEFFTKDTLFDFLHNRKTKPDGVLQKFLVPKGESSARHNFQIQAVWSPLVTLVYKRTNKHRLNDKTTPVHERAATFDGLAHYSSESLVADGTKSRIDALCKVIVKHFLVTEHKQITRFVLYFKVDDQDRLWVLWASSLRIGSDRLNPSYLRVPMQLAMRVENVNGGTSRDELTSARKLMHQQLVERDIDLYALTGDWAFASQCGQKFVLEEVGGGGAATTHESRHRSPSTSPDGRNATHHLPHPPSSSNGGSGAVPALEFVPTSAADDDEEKSAVVPPTSHPDGHQSASVAIPHYRGIASISGVSARTATSPHRHHHQQRFYISPRAPFLPTADRQVTSDVRSPRHPLHDAYVLTHAEEDDELRSGVAAAADRTAAFSGMGGGGAPGRKHANNASLSSSSKAVSGGGSARKKQYTVRIKKSEVERVFDDLNALAQEVVYDAYCATIEGSLVAPTTGTANGGEARSITFAPELMKCLNATEILQLAAILHVQQDATVETGDVFLIPAEAIGRGRRRDRPAAQIAEDVKQYFEKLFADPVVSERIVAAWRVLHV